MSIKRGKKGEVRRKRLSEHERVVALHMTQELIVNGPGGLTQKNEVGRNEMILSGVQVIDRPHVSCYFHRPKVEIEREGFYGQGKAVKERPS